jgi:7,8-dihydropterin-6-yl-methyl-4-(beta-D-ribofuranosyl)aminobenzene 5'-phosphate synthase
MRLPEIDRLRLTSVVDNYLDPLLKDEGPAQRRPRKGKAFERCLCSEHGLAEIVESFRGTEAYSVLFDFGASPLVYLHNLDLLTQDYAVDLGAIRGLVLSHGHWDHFGGLCGFLEQKRNALPADTKLYAGEDAFLHRWRVPTQGEQTDMGVLDEAFIRGRNVEIVRVKSPELLGGQVLVSGEIARVTPYEKGSPMWQATKDGRNVVDNLDGEQALVYHLRGKGLVVLTACGHAGVVNTVLHAREVTGIDRVHAVIGGFHLSGAPADRIAATVEGLAAVCPDVIVPMHCTGMATIEALGRRMPGRVIYNSAGTRYDLRAA